jgi:hypothetical protein
MPWEGLLKKLSKKLFLKRGERKKEGGTGSETFVQGKERIGEEEV